MSIVSTRTVVKVSKKITKEVILADGTTLRVVKTIKKKKVKPSYCLPQGVWELIKDFADMQVKYTNKMCGDISIDDFNTLFMQPQRVPPALATYIHEIMNHDDYEGQSIQYQKIMYSTCPSITPTCSLWTFTVPEMCGKNITIKYTFHSHKMKFSKVVDGETKTFDCTDEIVGSKIVRTPIVPYIANNLDSMQQKMYRKKLLGKHSCSCFLCFQNK